MNKSPSQIQFAVQRTVFDVDELKMKAQYEYPTSTYYVRTLYEGFKKMNYRKTIASAFPILDWLPNYFWAKDLGNDVIAGFTVAIMHIPQGMAYAILARLDPIIGIYMGFFPVFVYSIFGTSCHASIGTFAVLSLMCGQAIKKHADYTSMDVATAVAMDVALIQLVMYVLRLGVISILLSDTMVNAFTCAASFHILTAQLNDLFGVKIPERGAFGRVIMIFVDTARAFPNSNWVTFTLSVVSFSTLVIYMEVLKPRWSKRFTIPFPIELVCVVLGTLVSYRMKLKEDYKVDIVGNVPTGVPYFKIPSVALMAQVANDSFAIAIVSYTITLSMGFIIAQRRGYEIQTNQELLALGMSNFVGSFFSCMPVSASISRSLLQEGVGGVTQLTSIICCCFLLTVVLYIGPLFTNLPICVLSCIIAVYLKSTLLQIKSLKKYWFLNKWDFTVWIMTFTATVMVDVTTGLISGVCVSLFSVFMRGQQPHSSILASLPKSGLYLDVECYKTIQEIFGLKIFKYNGTLSYLTKDIFKATLYTKVGINPIYVAERRARMLTVSEDTKNVVCIIVDFSGIEYVDPSGVTALIFIVEVFKNIEIVIFVAACSASILQDMKKCEKFNNQVMNFMMFPTVHDAVLFAEANVLTKLN